MYLESKKTPAARVTASEKERDGSLSMSYAKDKSSLQATAGVKHYFSVVAAAEVGVNAAAILENIAFWVRHNRKSGRNCHEGKNWTYGSVRHFSEVFAYLTEKQVRGALDKLITCGYIETGNFNHSAYDRTRWFTLTPKGETITSERRTDVSKRANGFVRKGQPIPYKNNSSKTTGYMQDKTLGDYSRDPFDF